MDNFKPVTLCAKGTFFSLLMAACTATFTACNSDESSLPTAGNQLQISFGINAPQSRAIFTDTKLPDNSPVGVRLADTLTTRTSSTQVPLPALPKLGLPLLPLP